MNFLSHASRHVGGLLLALTALGASQQAAAATQCINQNAPAPLEICVQDSGTPGVWVSQPNGRQHQYYASYAWGSSIRLDGANNALQYNTGYFGGANVNPVSNTTTGTGTAADPYVITNVVDLGATGVRLTQQFRYVNGDRYFGKIWTLENTGATTFNDLRFFHGGDTYFGGQDSARSWYDATLGMVYVNNNGFSNSGYMAFYANPLTPFSHYFSGEYWMGLSQTVDGLLNDSFNSTFTDAGYYLQWNRATLAPGQSWRIEAFETWSPPGSLQILTPADEYVASGTTVRKTFKVHNLSDSASLSVTLNPTTASGWTLALPEGSSLNLAPLQVIEVPVDVQVPAGLAAGTSAAIVLNVTDGALNTSAGTTRLRIPSTDYAFSTTNLDFGAVPTGQHGDLTLTFTNGASPLSIGQVGASNGLLAPFTLGADTCSNRSLAANATCTVTVRFSPTLEALFTDSFGIPVASDSLVNQTITVSGSGSTPAFAVNAPAVPHGTISPATQMVIPGGTATFTITPANGYAIGTVSGCSGTSSGNTFTTGALTAACTLSVTFVEQMSDVTITGKGKGGGGASGPLLVGGLLLLLLRKLRTTATIAAAGLAITGGAQAGEAGVYAGASLGKASSSPGSASMTRQLQAQGYNVTARIDDNRTAWRLHGGWSLNRFLAGEIGYSDLGTVSTAYQGALPVLAVDDFLAAAVAIHPRTANGVDFSAVGRYPLPFLDKLAVHARAGVFRWTAERRVQTTDGRSAVRHDKGSDLLFGAGLDYAIHSHVALTADWLRYEMKQDNVDTLNVGLRYRW